jgi:hypothetical protein
VTQPDLDFHSLVTRFREAEELVCNDSERSRLLAAAWDLVGARRYLDWTEDEISDFLFVCSLDLDDELLPQLGLEGLSGEELEQARLRNVELARQSLKAGSATCRRHFVALLGQADCLDEEIESLLVCFAEDDDECVRRLAVNSLAQLQSQVSETLALKLWHRKDSHQDYSRMMALSVLQTIGSEHFHSLSSEASTGELPVLARYARALLEPVQSIPIARVRPRQLESLNGSILRFSACGAKKECLILPRLLGVEHDSLWLEAEVWLNTFQLWSKSAENDDRPCHQVGLRDLYLDVREVAYFCGQARAWLELPLSRIARLHFDGEFTLGAKDSQFDLVFRPCPSYPRKTDSFALTIHVSNGAGQGELIFESDRSCLEEFVSHWEELGS